MPADTFASDSVRFYSASTFSVSIWSEHAPRNPRTSITRKRTLCSWMLLGPSSPSWLLVTTINFCKRRNKSQNKQCTCMQKIVKDVTSILIVDVRCLWMVRCICGLIFESCKISEARSRLLHSDFFRCTRRFSVRREINRLVNSVV